MRELNSLTSQAPSVDRFRLEIQTISDDISSLEEKLGSAAADRSVPDIQREIDGLESTVFVKIRVSTLIVADPCRIDTVNLWRKIVRPCQKRRICKCRAETTQRQ